MRYFGGMKGMSHNLNMSSSALTLNVLLGSFVLIMSIYVSLRLDLLKRVRQYMLKNLLPVR